MTKALAIALAFTALAAAPVAAQGRHGPRGVPPGHLPSPGLCRVWYEGVPPGHQPPPTNCRRAELHAARDPSASIVYGRSRAYPSRGGYFDGPRRHTGAISLAFEYGYEDGFAGARSDLRRHGAYDPVRHKGYRSADRGYHKRYGARRHYRDLYREGFWAAYDAAYRDAGRYRRDGFAIVGTFRWPF